MKTKKMSKKLVLTKKTVADLNSQEMTRVFGGASVLPTCLTDCDRSRCNSDCGGTCGTMCTTCCPY
jgi:hypothetical protein